MSNLNKVVFGTGPDKGPFLNIDSTSFLGYTGLRHRLFLPENDCMLFDLGKDDFHAFWMKDVKIPLDMIFIDTNLEIVDIVSDTEPNTEHPISPSRAARFVVEVNAGWCEKHNIHVGTTVKFQSLI